MLLSAASSDRWELEVDGSSVERIEPFEWSNGFEVTEGGSGALSFHTSRWLYVALAIQTLVWLWVLRTVVWRRLDQPAGTSEEVA